MSILASNLPSAFFLKSHCDMRHKKR